MTLRCGSPYSSPCSPVAPPTPSPPRCASIRSGASTLGSAATWRLAGSRPAAHTESTPGAIRHDAVLDEATLATIDAGETCVDLVIRTGSAHDEPLDQYGPRFEIDGQDSRGVIESELVSVLDYHFTGEREVAAIQGVAANAFIGMSITQPTEQTFRVIERRARVCTGRGGRPRAVKLHVTHPSWDVASYNYHLDFAWQLDG